MCGKRMSEILMQTNFVSLPEQAEGKTEARSHEGASVGLFQLCNGSRILLYRENESPKNRVSLSL